MAVYKSKGIVLRSIRYGEADRILDLYTRDSGLVSAIAKGIRRTKSRFGARLEPLSCVDFLAYEGRSLDTITQAEVLRSFHGIREDLASLETAGGIVATTRVLAGGDEGDRRVFNLLYNALDTLDGRTEDRGSVESAFALKLSMLSGYALRLDACVSCERDLDGLADEGFLYYAPPLGGVLCPDCRQAGYVGDAFPIPDGTLNALRALVSKPLKETRVRDGMGESVRRVVSAHVIAHAPGNASLLGAPDRRSARPA